jgi:hypothetical protein
VRLQYNIIWIDDQPESIEEQIKSLDEIFHNEGFRLEIKTENSIENALGLLRDSTFKDNVDLILVDYDLGAGLKGDEGINAIREKIRYKDIIFYSGTNPKQFVDANKYLFEGIYYSNRTNLIETIKHIFIANTKKYLDIDHSRGIVLGGTSEIEQLITDCIKNIYIKNDIKTKNNIIGIIKNEFIKEKGIKNRFTKEFEKIEKSTKVDEILNYYNIITAKNRSVILRKVLENIGKLTS